MRLRTENPAPLHLIKLAAASGYQKTKLEPEDILHTLSQLTGLPPSILDNKERIDLKSVRDFFTRRVMGQDEAIECIVDRIAMLKASLNDAGRPIGVLLFARVRHQPIGLHDGIDRRRFRDDDVGGERREHL